MLQQLVYKNISVIPVIYLLVMDTTFSATLSEITKEKKEMKNETSLNVSGKL